MKISLHTGCGLLLAIASVAASTSALAQANNPNVSNPGGPFTLSSSPQTYIGLAAGQTDYKLGNGLGLFPSSNMPTAYILSGGAYFTPYLGVELAYTDFGQISRVGGNTRADGLSMRLVGKMPLSPSFNLLGKIGTTYGRTDVTSAAGSGVAGGKDNGFGLSLGIGAEYFFTPNISGVLQYDAHDLRFAGGANDRDRIGVTTLGVRYSF